MTAGSLEKVFVSLGDRSYQILIGEGLFSNSANQVEAALKRIVAGRSILIVVDSNTKCCLDPVLDRLGHADAHKVVVTEFPAGEASKNFETVVGITRAAVRSGLDRSSVIIGLGGGVTGDMAAFAASIYMRGIDCIQIPTSLLAMIDSSVGGKTGVNLPEGKNLIGTFHQPKAVFIDTAFLKSLDVRQLRTGFAELIKHGILFDESLFSLLNDTAEEMTSLSDLPMLSRLAARSCQLKANVVSGDERESSQRMLLNLGHTFGHAIEKLQNYSTFTHGEALSVGLVMAAQASVLQGVLKPEELAGIESILVKYGLPVRVSGFSPEMVLEAMRSDKKSHNGQLRLILPQKIGQAAICPDVPDDLVLNAIGACCD